MFDLLLPAIAGYLFFKVLGETVLFYWALSLRGTKRQRRKRYLAWRAGFRNTTPLFTIRRTWVDDEILAIAAVLLIVMGVVLVLVAHGDITP